VDTGATNFSLPVDPKNYKRIASSQILLTINQNIDN
jgi:hypothetical protein